MEQVDILPGPWGIEVELVGCWAAWNRPTTADSVLGPHFRICDCRLDYLVSLHAPVKAASWKRNVLNCVLELSPFMGRDYQTQGEESKSLCLSICLSLNCVEASQERC